MAAAALLFVALVLGGASRLHEMRLALVELAALPLLVTAVASLYRASDQPASKLALGIIVAIGALPLIQLIPLPPAIWAGLPGREQLSLALDVAEISPGWAPLSLTPDLTWRSFLALVPPIAMFLGVLACGSNTRLRLIAVLLAGAVVSVLLGSAQLASGSERLYPWRSTDAGSVVGFFANRNHLATLCLLSIPFAAALGARDLRRGDGRGNVTLWISALFIALMVIALGVIRSRVGVLLVGPSLLASLAVAWLAAGRDRPKLSILGIMAGAAVAMVAVSFFALGPILDRFGSGGAAEGRFENWPVVVEAAESYLPFGSGIGSFDAVYRSVEPLERLDATFFNQAHNEYLEIWLEAGILGIGVVVVFLVWFARRSWSAWTGGVGTQRDIQRAATVAIVMVLLHSVVDYPLRTAALATVFAMCCAILELSAHTLEEIPRRRRRIRALRDG
ncbi:MAG: O-antigen ligase family protein [Brevundimonas sp.]|uniref:O-antigen ligase family protein n=1 Tax=Brevundimonas sp. TaxID=1871086 RepID=UPI003919B71A